MHKSIPEFWSRWVLLLSLVLIVYGLAMAIAPKLMNDTLVAPLLYHDAGLRGALILLAEPVLSYVRVLYGLLGAVTTGWAIMIGWIAFHPFRKGEPWAWNALVVTVSAWALLESYVKLVNGLGPWSMAHLSLLLAYSLPLVVTYRHFHPSAKT